MTSLFRRLRQRPEARDITTVDEYIAAVADAMQGGMFAAPPPGVTQTLGGTGTEPAPTNFVALSQQMFGASSVVFACMLARLSVFSAARFQYQRFRGGRPSTLFGDPSLGILERPWVGGTTPNLLTRMITDVDLAGNAYVTRQAGELVRLRPDWVDIAMMARTVIGEDGVPRTLGWRKIGYLYYEDGVRDDRAVALLPDEVAHFAPIPDPLATYRGMSWVTRVIREVAGDNAMTDHKARFVANAATPNMVIRHSATTTMAQAAAVKALMADEYEGPQNAGKTLHIGGGADLTVVGKDFKELDFRGVQGAGETRIAAAAGTPPIIVGLSEGLQSATYSNYGQARRRFADGTLHPLWTDVAGALAQVVPAPGASRLWYDVRDVAFLREDSTDAAKIAQIQATTIRSLVDGGFEPDSVVQAVVAQDMTLLAHSGRLSVQLQTPGEGTDGAPLDGGATDDSEGDDDAPEEDGS